MMKQNLRIFASCLQHRMTRFSLAVLFVGVFCLGGLDCSTPPSAVDGGLVLCQSTSDCPKDFVCQMNSCLQRPSTWGPSLTSKRDGGERPSSEPVTPDSSRESLLSSENTGEAPLPEKPNSGCQNDGDCGAGRICAQGKCQIGCRTSQDCRDGKICLKLVCQPCDKDQDCAAGQLCLQQKCRAGNCRVSTDCIGGKLCKANLCSACTNDTDCDVGTLCQNDGCVPGSCRKHTDCPGGLLCKQSKCVACTSDAECGAGRLCFNQACIAGDCRETKDCSGGKACIKNNCASCTKNLDCGAGKVCSNAVCIAGDCLTNADCQGGKVCSANFCSPCVKRAECGSGRVCAKGVCHTGNCAAHSDCSGGQVCKSNYICGVCADNKDCPTATPSCVQGVCQIGVVNDAQKNAKRWSDGTFARDCAEYRFPPKGRSPGTSDGVYLIKPIPAQPEFPVHCDMTYAGGGWTLILKVDGSRNEFLYKNALWTNQQTYNATKPAFDNQQAKLKSYFSVGVQEILLRMRDPASSGPLRSLIVRKKAASFYALVQPGKRVSFEVNAGKSAWKSLVRSPSLQFGCNLEGINIAGNGTGDIDNVRIGFLNNDFDSCRSTDSFIGLGSDRLSAGNFARWNGFGNDRTTKTFAYLYVRDLRSTTKLKEHKGALRNSDGTSEKSCLAYRLPPTASTKSGLYWIQPTGQTAFQVYCLMLTQGGGWTLLLKADGLKTTFQYDASLWTNKTPLNANSPGFNFKEAKLQSYATVPFSEVYVMMFKYPIPSRRPPYRHVIVSKKATSMYDLLRQGTPTSFDVPLGTQAWRDVVGGGNVQTNCNREGFNSISTSRFCKNAPSSGSCARVRIGLIGDNNNCDSPDSRIGVGGSGGSCNQNNSLSVGNTHQCTSNPNRRDRREIFSFGHVWVR